MASISNCSSVRSTVTIEEAAQIAGRSTSWVRVHRSFGPLVPVEIDGLQAVTLSSLRWLIADRNSRNALRDQKRRAKTAASAAPTSKRRTPALYLAVDNTLVK